MGYLAMQTRNMPDINSITILTYMSRSFVVC